MSTHTIHFYDKIRTFSWNIPKYFEGWAQDWRKSDGCFSPNLISSPWRRYEDYNISFCKQWKFSCHCSYEQWHLNLHCLQRGPSYPLTRVSKICLSYYSLALNLRFVFFSDLKNLWGTQKRVRIIQGKRAIGVRVIEISLYTAWVVPTFFYYRIGPQCPSDLICW